MYSTYVNNVRENLNLNNTKWNFKEDSNYRWVLEHVSIQEGEKYLELLNNNSKFINNKASIINICIENDKYGKPIKSTFNKFCICSPTNLRYIYHAFLILEYMNKKNLSNINIIEIGGGYGGLALFIHRLSNIFNIELSSYTIFDLKDVIILQKKYLELHNINNINTLDIYDNDYKNILKKESFLISNYGFSEFRENIRNDYSNQIIKPYVSYGFLAWNGVPLYNFSDKKMIHCPENPLTGASNLYVYIEPNL